MRVPCKCQVSFVDDALPNLHILADSEDGEFWVVTAKNSLYYITVWENTVTTKAVHGYREGGYADPEFCWYP